MVYRKIFKPEKEYYMNLRRQGKTQKESSVRSGISERHGRRLESTDNLVEANTATQSKKRTRQDPLSLFWESDIVPMLRMDPSIMAVTIFEELQDRHPDKIDQSKMRTLHRRVREWKILNGNEKEVMFTQRHIPGEMALSDFTKLKDVTITIKGEEFDHLLYHYKLAYSNWGYVKVIQGGESFTALSSGMQEAFERSGGVPKNHRTDSLSAAYNNNSQKDLLTANYEALCNHYNVEPTRNNLGVSHENGSVESSHGHLKRKIKQALILRQSNDFDSIESYQEFINKIVARRNKACAQKFAEEKQHLSSLPKHKCQEFALEHVFVSSASTVRVKRVLYTMPSNLVGLKLRARIYDDRLEFYYNSKRVHKVKRVYATKEQYGYSINYRHIIFALAKKPQAFRGYMWRDKLLPNADYRVIWELADESMSRKSACKYIVNILVLAAKQKSDGELVLSRYILREYERTGKLVSIHDCQRKFGNLPDSVPIVETSQHQLSQYDLLLTSEANHA